MNPIRQCFEIYNLEIIFVCTGRTDNLKCWGHITIGVNRTENYYIHYFERGWYEKTM